MNASRKDCANAIVKKDISLETAQKGKETRKGKNITAQS